MKSFCFTLVILFSVQQAVADTLTKEFKGHIANNTTIEKSEIQFHTTWNCVEGLIEPYNCGFVENDVPLATAGSFVVHPFSVPRLKSGQREVYSFSIRVASNYFHVVDTRARDYRDQLTHISFSQVNGVTMNASLRNERDINVWIRDRAPNKELNFASIVSGAVPRESGSYKSIVKFPFTIPDQFFVFYQRIMTSQSIITSRLHRLTPEGMPSLHSITFNTTGRSRKRPIVNELRGFFSARNNEIFVCRNFRVSHRQISHVLFER